MCPVADQLDFIARFDVKVHRAALDSRTTAKAFTFMPTGVAATCWMSRRVPRLCDPGGSRCSIAASAAASKRLIITGVARTCTRPLPTRGAVCSSPTRSSAMPLRAGLDLDSRHGTEHESPGLDPRLRLRAGCGRRRRCARRRSRSRWSTGPTTTSSSRCSTRSPPRACRRPSSRRRSATSSPTSVTRRCCWARAADRYPRRTSSGGRQPRSLTTI